MSIDTILLNNDGLIVLVLTDRDEDPINNAEVIVYLYDKSENLVSGIDWPLTMDYVAASNGRYEVVLESTVEVADKKRYILIAVISGPSGSNIPDGEFRKEIVAYLNIVG